MRGASWGVDQEAPKDVTSSHETGWLLGFRTSIYEPQVRIIIVSLIMMRVLCILALVVLGIPAIAYLFWGVHCAMDYCCVRHARRYCRKKGFGICRLRCQPAFEHSGVKTEFTLVQLDCLDTQKQRKLLLLLVWPFGVRKVVSEEKYPESYDEQWSQQKANNSKSDTAI
jgi:hypothetical protein